MKKIFAFLTLISFSAWAERKCTFEGKEFDIYRAANRDTFSGVVKCKNEFSSDDVMEEQETYKNGRLIEERFDGKNRKEVIHYYPDSPNQWRHGEHLEYYPKTNKIRRKENYDKMHQVGLQESFYEDGRIESRKFYTHESEKSGSAEVASVGYLQNGDIQYLRCSKDKKTTIEPKLCGFEGRAETKTRSQGGEVQRTVTHSNGNLVEEEIPYENFSRGGYSLEGTFPEPKPKVVKVTYDGSNKKYVYTYPNGKVKREFTVGERGLIEGKDNEYFQSGAPVRKTEFVKGEAQNGECWWENTKPRAKYSKTSDGLFAIMTWDTGVQEIKGNFIANSRYSNPTDDLNRLMLSCSYPNAYFDRDGAFIELNKEGKKVFEGTFKKGMQTGWQKSYDKDGVLEEEALFDENQKPQQLLEKKIYENGKLKKHEKYNSDGSIKN